MKPHNSMTFMQNSGRLAGLVFLLFMVLTSWGCSHHEKYPKHAKSDHGTYMSERYSGTHADMGFHHPDFSSSLEEELSLSGDQKEAFRRIDKDYRKMVIEKQSQIRSEEVDLAVLLEVPEVDRAALRKQVDSIGELKKEMMMSRLSPFLNSRAF